MNAQLAFTDLVKTREEPVWLWPPFLARGLIRRRTPKNRESGVVFGAAHGGFAE